MGTQVAVLEGVCLVAEDGGDPKTKAGIVLGMDIGCG